MSLKNKRKSGLGFTLLELIIVITIIALLAAATFVAVDPAKRIGQANNAQRWSDVTAILNAILTYVVDNSGTYPGSGWTNNQLYVLGTTSEGCDVTSLCTATNTAQASCLNLASDLIPTFLATIPQDPLLNGNSASHTDYYIYQTTGGRVTVGACERYNNEKIEVSR